MTPGQPTSFRLTEEASQMIEELKAHLGVKRTAVVEMAVRQLYRKELGVKPAKKKPKNSGEDA
jgi:hypothetical protein